MSDAAAQGQKLLDSGDFLNAITKFDEAIRQYPTSPDFYIKRSMAHHKAKKYAAALEDSEEAVVHAYKRQNKDLRATAQFRRRPVDAKFCIDLAVRDGCKDKSIPIWQGKIDRATEGRSETATVSEIPESMVTTKTDTVMRPSAPIPSMTAPPKKPNFDWYQNDKDVIVTFYARNVPADKCKLEIHSQSVSLEFPLPNESTYMHEFEHLCGPVIASESSHRVLGTKIELTLRKASPGRWQSLESTAPVETKPQYPTSSKRGPTNWDAISPAEEKADGDAAVTQLFQTLYKDADEDTRKAMIKSYTESGGTALSTDWSSVKAGKVEMKPPEGMEARPYEQ